MSTTDRDEQYNELQRSNEDDSSIQDRCPICLNTIVVRTYINQCKHEFCKECILNWVKNKIVCPLCKVQFNEVTTTDSNGELQTIYCEEPPMPHPSKVEADLSCLDHLYFIEEINKLATLSESVGYSVQHSPSTASTSQKVYISGATTKDTITLTTINDNLKSLRNRMDERDAFVPEELLSELYMIECTLRDLQQHYQQKSINFNNHFNSSGSRRRNGGNSSSSGSIVNTNNYYYQEDYDDDYEDEDDDIDDESDFYYNYDNQRKKERYSSHGNDKVKK